MRVVRQSSLTQLSANAALLVSTEWQCVVQHVVLVDPNRARPERVADTKGCVEIAGVHGSSEAVGRGVADANGIFFRLELGDGADGAENLFLHDLHVFRHVAEDCRLNEVALFAMALTANLDRGAFLAAVVDVAVQLSQYPAGRRMKRCCNLDEDDLPHDTIIL